MYLCTIRSKPCIFRNFAGENVEGQSFFISEVSQTVVKNRNAVLPCQNVLIQA